MNIFFHIFNPSKMTVCAGIQENKEGRISDSASGGIDITG